MITNPTSADGSIDENASSKDVLSIRDSQVKHGPLRTSGSVVGCAVVGGMVILQSLLGWHFVQLLEDSPKRLHKDMKKVFSIFPHMRHWYGLWGVLGYWTPVVLQLSLQVSGFLLAWREMSREVRERRAKFWKEILKDWSGILRRIPDWLSVWVFVYYTTGYGLNVYRDVSRNLVTFAATYGQSVHSSSKMMWRYAEVMLSMSALLELPNKVILPFMSRLATHGNAISPVAIAIAATGRVILSVAETGIMGTYAHIVPAVLSAQWEADCKALDDAWTGLQATIIFKPHDVISMQGARENVIKLLAFNALENISKTWDYLNTIFMMSLAGSVSSALGVATSLVKTDSNPSKKLPMFGQCLEGCRWAITLTFTIWGGLALKGGLRRARSQITNIIWQLSLLQEHKPARAENLIRLLQLSQANLTRQMDIRLRSERLLQQIMGITKHPLFYVTIFTLMKLPQRIDQTVHRVLERATSATQEVTKQNKEDS